MAVSSPLGPARTISDDEFDRIRDLVKNTTGISLGSHKRDLVVSRLNQRLRNLDLESFSDYLQYLENADSDEELVNMINRITTNKTDFFRENHHFEFLRDTVLPEIVKENSGKLRCWSAGCSSGQEPYSIAMILQDFFAGKPGWDYRILATDLDTNILRQAAGGMYNADQVEPIEEGRVKRYFDSKGAGQYQVKPVLRKMVMFKKFNFMTPQYKMKARLDFIFCRNVMIYFDAKAKNEMVRKFAQVLKPKGYLFVGHSESLMMAKDIFENVGPTIYRKVE